jgi:hypothetical protein
MLTSHRSTIIDYYNTLHRVGILHADVAVKHWLCNETGDPSAFRLIDFEGAIFRDELSADEWAEKVAVEMWRVENEILSFKDYDD